MPIITEFQKRLIHRKDFTGYLDIDFLSLCAPAQIKILIVTDGSVGLSPTGFGLGLVLDTLRAPAYDYAEFTVHTARRTTGAFSENTSPGDYGFRYTGFTFDRTRDGGGLIIDEYDEIWMFGFNPGNDAGPDSNIVNDPTNLSDSELIKLTEWMNDRDGGVLAMGDHDYLGATMCWKIPRVRHMRRWTNAQNVPPIGGAGDADTHLRHDTNQPRTAGQQDGTSTIPFSNQGDTLPQTIDPKRYYIGGGPFFGQFNYEPHPILCSRDHGLIDILPDHPHEGWVYEDSEVEVHATYSFSEGGLSLSGSDFPVVGGVHETPEVIAWAWTTPNPPYLLAKGPSPLKRFGVIGVYDGHAANVGRVAVDSTWHHWFSENLLSMKNDTTTNHYERLQDYFRNCAVWLAPPTKQQAMLRSSAWNSLFTSAGVQDLVPSLPWLLGPSAKDLMGKSVSACTIREWTWTFLIPELIEFRPRKLPIPSPPCLSCPPIDFFETAALGAFFNELLPLQHKALRGELAEKEIGAGIERAVAHVRKKAVPEMLRQWESGLKVQAASIEKAKLRVVKGKQDVKQTDCD